MGACKMEKSTDSSSYCARHGSEGSKLQFSRRCFAKVLLAAGATGAGVALLPTTWVKPVVEKEFEVSIIFLNTMTASN
jgi:DNA-binding transcriptional LysR family regulator